MSAFATTIATLSATEDFFEFLGVPYDPATVRVKRLHILKRFNERLGKLELDGLDDEALRNAYAAALANAYQDLLALEPREAALFKVFQQTRAFVPLSAVVR